jgi:hypothetical protein
MPIDEKIQAYLDNWSLTNSATGEIIKLTPLQSEDTNRALQKPYCLLHWEQGSGKTISGMAQMQYRLSHNNITQLSHKEKTNKPSKIKNKRYKKADYPLKMV